MIEAITDFVFLTQVSLFPYFYSVSLDGKGPVNFRTTLQKVGIQIAIEIAMDFAVTMYLAVIQNYHLMTNSISKCRRYGLVLGLMVFLSQPWLVLGVYTNIFCGQNP